MLSDFDTKFSQWIQKTWDVIPKNLDLYKKAITLPEYETLEFLGDSLLDFIVADYLVRCFPDKPPGWLTKKRMTFVNENTLSELAKRIGIHNIAIFPSTSSSKQITGRVLGDMIESLIAAIYIDQGIEVTQNSIQKIMELEKTTEDLSMRTLDPIGSLQEFLAHKNLPHPDYRLVKVSGTEHEPVFVIEVSCKVENRLLKATGHGKNKKEASKEAAQGLLQNLEGIKIQEPFMYLVSSQKEENLLQELHIFLAKKGMKLPVYKEEEIKSGSFSSFIVEASCEFQGTLFVEKGEGLSKKKARQVAAKKLLKNLKKYE